MVIEAARAPGAQWTQCVALQRNTKFILWLLAACRAVKTLIHVLHSRALRQLPDATMAASCLMLDGHLQLAVCTNDGRVLFFRCK